MAEAPFESLHVGSAGDSNEWMIKHCCVTRTQSLWEIQVSRKNNQRIKLVPERDRKASDKQALCFR